MPAHLSPEGRNDSGQLFEPSTETGDPTKYNRGLRKGSTVLPNRRTSELNSKNAFSIDNLPVIEINETIVGEDDWGEPIIESNSKSYRGDMIAKVGVAQSPSELPTEEEPCQNPKPTTTSDSTSPSEATTPSPTSEPTSKSKTTPTPEPRQPSPIPKPTPPVAKERPSHLTTAAPANVEAISYEQAKTAFSELTKHSHQQTLEAIGQLSERVEELKPSKDDSSTSMSTRTRMKLTGQGVNMACDAVSITRTGNRIYALFEADGTYIIPPKSEDNAELHAKILGDDGLNAKIVDVMTTGVAIPFNIDDKPYIITLFLAVD